MTFPLGGDDRIPPLLQTSYALSQGLFLDGYKPARRRREDMTRRLGLRFGDV